MARRATLAAVLGLMLVAAQAANAAPPNTGTIYHSVQVAPGTTTTFRVSCPPGYAAVAGGMVAGKLLATGAVGPLLAVTSVPPGAYSFTLGVPAGRPAQFLTVSVRCMRLGVKANVKALKLKVVRVTGKPVVLAPGTLKSQKLGCPTGDAPTGGGYEEHPAGATPKSAAPAPRAAAAAPYPLELGIHPTTSMPVRGGWSYTFANDGRAAAELRTEVTCVKRHYRGFEGSRVTTRDETIVRETAHHDLRGHSESTIGRRCPIGDPLGSGFQFSPSLDLLAVTGARRRPAGFVFDVLNGQAEPVSITEYELCDVHRYSG